jgi:hypothetical protein
MFKYPQGEGGRQAAWNASQRRSSVRFTFYLPYPFAKQVCYRSYDRKPVSSGGMYVAIIPLSITPPGRANRVCASLSSSGRW